MMLTAALPPPTAPRPGRTRGGIGIVLTLGAAIMTALVAVAPKEGNVDDIETWRWVWLASTVVLGVGEMLSAGFFMLPFAIGAAAAGLLAFFSVAIWIQLVTFLVVSILSLIALRRFAHRANEPLYAVGSQRFVNAAASVIEPVDRRSGTGRVRLEKELWGATTDLDVILEPGTAVRVVEVRGARLVVVPDETT